MFPEEPAQEESTDEWRPHSSAPRTPRTRRNFLGLAAAGVVTAGGAALTLRDQDVDQAGLSADDPAIPTTSTTPLHATADYTNRTLVVVELSGGNDALATLVPRNSGVLYDQRPAVHIPDEELIDFTDAFGWNPSMSRLAGHGVAALVGVGTNFNPDGSHFEMEKRWWSGQSTGTDLPATGFLGRLCDQLTVDQPVTGLAVGSGANPSLLSDKAVTMGLSDPGAAWFLHNEDPWLNNMRAGLRFLSHDGVDDSDMIRSARSGLVDTLAFADSLGELNLERVDDLYPGGELGWQFGLASELLAQDAGIRVIHISHGGFDTHSSQRGDHDYLLEQLSEAMSTFLEDVADQGRADSTLVCTTSEFGRRVPDNDGGTDHGAASTAFLAGPVVAGLHGEPPSLTNTDEGNLIATVDFESYYATIAEKWFGIPASEVLVSGAAPIEGLVAT